jgi:hypothetical protein
MLGLRSAIGIGSSGGSLGYRKRIPITGASGAGTNYQVLLEVNSGTGADSAGVVYLNGKALDFPDDLRFTDSDGITKIPYWIDTVLSTLTKNYCWVRVSDDLSSGTQYIYIYYGRSGVSSLSSGIDTFNFYDDFNYFPPQLETELVENFTTYEELEALIQPNKYVSNPIISHGGGWKDSQLHYPCILIDPTDATKLMMWVGGLAAPVSTGEGSIGLYYGTVADPYTWVPYAGNPVFTKNGVSGWEFQSVFPDTVIWNPVTSRFWMYYTGCSAGNVGESVGLATSIDGITWVREGTNPILTPTGQGRDDGDVIGNGGVLREDATHWYMYYCYRDGAATLEGIRCASSSDGITWVKGGSGDIVHIGAAYDTTYIEGVQVIKLGTKFVLIYGCYDGTYWGTAIAASINFDAGFVKSSNNPLLDGSHRYGTWDKKGIATTKLFKIGSKWYAYYQGCDGDAINYSLEEWDLGVATFDFTHNHFSTLLNGSNGWVADEVFIHDNTIKVEGEFCASSSHVSSKNADRTIVISNTLGSVSFYIATSSVGVLDYWVSVYIMEGANIVTGATIREATIQHLKSGAWEDVQAGCSINTFYKITIEFPTKSTHKLYVNDILIGGIATSNFTNITTAINMMRMQSQQSGATHEAYFDLLKVQEYISSPPNIGIPEAEETINRYP